MVFCVTSWRAGLFHWVTTFYTPFQFSIHLEANGRADKTPLDTSVECLFFLLKFWGADVFFYMFYEMLNAFDVKVA